jgi:glycyl-tRNA synthetase (class II)
MKDELTKPDCRLATECAFYQKSESDVSPLNKRLRIEYCMKSHTQCARWKIHHAIGFEWIPDNMLPYQHERTKQILNETGVGHERIVHHQHVTAGV